MNYYFYNGNIFTKQNMTRAGYNTNDAQLLTDDEVSMYLTDIEDGYQRVNGKLELELIPVTDDSAKTEYYWAKAELENADIGLNKVLDGTDEDTTETQWRGYRRALRAYVTVSDGVYSVVDLTDVTYTINDVEYSVTLDDDTGRPVSPSDV